MRTVIISAAMSIAAMQFACGTSSTQTRQRDMLARFEASQSAKPLSDGRELFAEASALSRAELVSAVLERNPDIEAARHAWKAASAEVTSSRALPDPMLRYMMAPLTIGSEHPYGQEIQLSQTLLWPGKRDARAAAALARAEAAETSAEVVRLELARMASDSYDEYALVGEALEVNAHHRALLEELADSARAQYAVGRASQQDPLQAEVELANLERERLTLESRRDTLVARLNRLLHRAPILPLPPPTQIGIDRGPIASLDQLIAKGVGTRPELDAIEARVRVGMADKQVAERNFYPDVELMGTYSSMWQTTAHQWMVGIGLRLPIWREQRQAAVDRAEALTAEQRSRRQAAVDEIRTEVATAYRQVQETAELVEVYQQRLVPVARDQVEAARAGLTAGTNSFLAAVEAEKNLRDAELGHIMAKAELSKRTSALERAVGEIPGLARGIRSGETP